MPREFASFRKPFFVYCILLLFFPVFFQLSSFQFINVRRYKHLVFSRTKKEMDVHTALDSLLLLYKSDFKSKKISAIRKYAEGFPLVRVVPDQFKQVFLNLLKNATDACSEKGGVITIITCHDNQKAVIARISHEHCVEFQNNIVFSRASTLFHFFSYSTQCSPKVSPCGAIFRSILPVNIDYYGSLPKTLKLTPPELMRNPG